jgi:hypothetical protein
MNVNSGDLSNPHNAIRADNGSGQVTDGKNFHISGFNGSFVVYGGAPVYPAAEKQINPSQTWLTGTAANGFGAVGNPVTGNFNVKAALESGADNFYVSGTAKGQVVSGQ